MIRFGMGLMEIVEQLTRGFMKATGKQPGNLEKLKIQQEAVQRFKDMNKVMDMQGRPIDPSKPIMGGSQQGEALKSGIMKATGARPRQVLSEDEIRQKLLKNNEEGLASMKKKLEDPEERAMGGRIGYKIGAGKKGVQALLDLVRDKFGKKAVTTGDKAPIPPKTLERDMFKKADKRLSDKRMLDDDEYQDFLDEVGGADQLEAYDFDGTVGDAKRIIKEQKQYMDDMELEYKKGNLDPKPGEKGRKEFLQKKLDEVEASGDQRLMTPDEIEELSSFDLQAEMDVAKSLAPKMVERLHLKQKYPGITDDLLDKILIDDNMQRKAEVLATIDEAFRMMEKGKSADEILDTMKNVTRTKQADGGITRIGLKAGSVDKMRRLFLKAIGAGTAGVGAAKSGIFSFGKGAGKEVAKEVAQQTTSSMPPPYFFKLAEKIKMMGDDVTAKAATKDREVVTKFKDYELTEDAATGEMTIQRMKVLDDDSGSFYGNPLTEETYMNYKPGLADETTKGKIPPSEYEEGTALIRSDREYAGEVVDESFEISDDVLKEVGEAPSIKKASGGLAYMLGE